jgi:hypothetical protein
LSERRDALRYGASKPSAAPLNREFMISEVQLAWALATVADPYLGTAERHDLYIAIAVGDTFSAIYALTARLVREDLALPTDLVTDFAQWLNGYVGHDEEPRLRGLLAQVKTYPPP